MNDFLDSYKRLEKLCNEAGEPVEVAPHPKERLIITAPLPLEPGDILRERLDPQD